ncbi:MAG: aminopeptidase [Candidatus Nanohaloarchaea archaeon]|nr:aminopeptidase [Candidatus Nanohaloarchaea archaeon]
MDLTEGAETAVHQCMDVQDDEEVLIVADDAKMRIARALQEVGREAAAETMLMNTEPTDTSGSEPPAAVAAAMKEADVIFAPTTHSLSHTRARIAACEAGARAATMPGVTEEIFTTSMLADYEAIKRRSRRLYERVEETDEIHVTSPGGTDLRLDVNMKVWEQDTGIVHKPGGFTNLPAGEVFGVPLAAEGQIVFDSFVLGGEEKAPEGTAVEVTNSVATGISEECELSRAFKEVENATNLAELGIGTNAEAEVIGNALQDEKAMGTCHFAFGDNTAFGGHTGSEIHWDGIVKDPTIRFDEEVIMEKGEFTIDL